MPFSLAGKVALVAGASRGAGRCIAAELGKAGATVYVTGRSVKGMTTMNFPGSLDDTVSEIRSAGGTAFAVRCDHTKETEVEALKSTESPYYVGRAVCALAGDPNVFEKTGRVLQVGELAKEYGFADIDGRQVPPFRIP